MKNLLLVATALVGLVACKSSPPQHVAECDAFMATADKLAKCEKLDPEQRKQVEDAAKGLRTALKSVDDAGGVGDAPKELVDTLRTGCKSQDDMVKKAFAAIAPECVK